MTNLQYHLQEIKLRVFYLILSAICTFLISYNYQIEIIYIIGKPFIELQQTFIFLELTEAFYSLLKISAILTLLFIFPFMVYQIWSFVIPSFYKLQRNQITFFFFLFFCLFISELFFIYFVLLPKICNFLISFQLTSEMKTSLHIQPLISVEFTARIESYVRLLVKIFTIILTLLQIPLFIYFLYSKKLLQVSSFYFNRKILSLISLLTSAFIVPPDVISQLILALFFYVLFEIIIFIGFFFE